MKKAMIGAFMAMTLGAYASVDTNALASVIAQANAGDPRAETYIATCYMRGVGVKMDMAKAVALFRSAADKGYAGAQNNLGYCYANGIGVATDDAEAVKWWKLAAEQGLPEAEYWLGASYRDGKGVEKDLAKAKHWLRLAAEKDFTPNGLTRDSLEQIRTAAERGDVASQTYLAGCYARGILVPLDYDEALKWFRRAAILGDEKAKEAVRRLEKEMGE